MGVVNNFAINRIVNLGEIKEINVLVRMIILGIFNFCVCLVVFFIFLIFFYSLTYCIVFLLILEKHKSTIIYKFYKCF